MNALDQAALPQHREVFRPQPVLADAAGRPTGRLRLGLGLLAVALCCLHAYANRHLINPDGLSYLDLATGDGRPNGYWSPLYPWLLGLALRGAGATPYWECAVAHGVAVLCFLGSLMAFEWLLSELMRLSRAAHARPDWDAPLPDWAVVTFSYALFTFVARRLITVSLLTPDALVAACFYAGCALLLRMRRRPGWPAAFLLGMVLGVGFLAKAIFFLLAFAFLGAALFTGPLRVAARRVLLAAAVFAAVAAVVVVPLSLATGKPTYGESGRLNYLWYVHKAPRPERLAASSGTSPVVPLPPSPGTYGLWYDPSPFFADGRPRLDVAAQLAASTAVAASYYQLLTVQLAPFTVSLCALLGYAFLARYGRSGRWLAPADSLCCLLPALAGLGLYLLVGHAEGRLVGPFLVVAGSVLVAAVRLNRRRLGAAYPLVGSLLACLLLLLAGNLLFDAGNAAASARAGEGGAAHPHAAVARELAAQGLRPGESVGSIGFGYNAYWARLAGVHIAAEVAEYRAGEFWALSDARRAAALERFRAVGVRFVVCDHLPGAVPGWRRVEGTRFAWRPIDGRSALTNRGRDGE